MKINKYFPFAFIYLFVNSVGLPPNLLYTMLLTPVFYLWLVVRRQRFLLAGSCCRCCRSPRYT
jgi:hypothetical protein